MANARTVLMQSSSTEDVTFGEREGDGEGEVMIRGWLGLQSGVCKKPLVRRLQ